ncbi:MAG: esterase-like activity of phytase family protein [Alphaproteobacteria bacterium]|nr:esterase-like activity of phytase family protein [Alphaproteobacteria bacterium]
MVRIRGVAALLAPLLLISCAQQDWPADTPGLVPIAVTADPVTLDPARPTAPRFGRLEYLGGVTLRAPSVRFGGWSGLALRPDGQGLVAVSDRGWWLEGVLQRDEAGRLVGIGAAHLGPLLSRNGAVMSLAFRDAEEVVLLPDGAALVAFETRGRIWRYETVGGRAAAQLQVPGATEVTSNRGLEAMARLTDGRLVLVMETSGQGWVGGEGDWQPFRYTAADGHAVSGAAALPDGDLMVIERGFGPLSLWSIRLVRVAAAALSAGAEVRGEELALLHHPLAIDNIEAAVAWRAPTGETRLLLLSDDNYQRVWQRTQLLEFRLLQDPAQ